MYRLWKGRKVKIFSADKKKELGIGKYIDSKMTSLRFRTPRFRLGSKVICGYECWWIPLSEVKKGDQI